MIDLAIKKINDKYFNLLYNRFTNENYLDQIFCDPNSPYYIQSSSKSLKLEEIKDAIDKVDDSAKSILNFINLFYNKWHLNGEVFGNSQRFARFIYDCQNTTLLNNNPVVKDLLLKCIKSLLNDENTFKLNAIKTKSTRTQGTKDNVFIINKLPMEYKLAKNVDEFKKLPKCYLDKDKKRKEKLNAIGILVNKNPDAVIKNGNIIFIIENKYQVESGGGQKNSKKDGVEIFTYSNESNFNLKRIFCFDGNINYITEFIEHINDDNKIMSIFDVNSFIEEHNE